MTFVSLWIPPDLTGAARGADLAPALLRVAPRVHVGPEVIWADARGLRARPLAEALLDLLRDEGVDGSRAATAMVPIAAQVAAVHGAGVHGATVRGDDLIEIAPGEDRAFLAPFPLGVLSPEPRLWPLLSGTGMERCGDLAALTQESVEVRFGPAGIALWRLARADDTRILFDPIPRALPNASLEWSDYALRDPERLLFVINRLAGSVCGALHELGQGARAFTLTFALERGEPVAQPFHPSRAGADQRTWMRLIRDALERVRLPAGVVGVALRVDAAGTSESVQGDVLDRGFASAGAAAEALAAILDRDAVIVTPVNSRHPLPRRRTTWVEQQPSLVWARPQLGPGDTEPALALHLLPEPELVEAETADREGFAAPLRYRTHERGGEVWHELVAASGPDCLSGGRWDAAYAYEVYCCVRADGELVQLCRDARHDRWEVHGIWR